MSNIQQQFDVAVVVPTMLRHTLTQCIESIFNQTINGRVQILIGIDKEIGDRAQLDFFQKKCPNNMSITLMDLGYSTSARHGGIYSNFYGGAIRTILSYAANSPYVAYLDDDDWWRVDHLETMLNAVSGNDWAFSYRWFVDKDTNWLISKDEWDSVGPGRGINNDRFGGFVGPSSLILAKSACHLVFPYWSLAPFKDGSGEDRLIFRELMKLNKYSSTGEHTCFCIMDQSVEKHIHHREEFQKRNIDWIYDRSLIDEIMYLEDDLKKNFNNLSSSVINNTKRLLSLNGNSLTGLTLAVKISELSGRAADRDIFRRQIYDITGCRSVSDLQSQITIS